MDWQIQPIASNIGFGFQLNAWSPKGQHPTEDGWRQYGYTVDFNTSYNVDAGKCTTPCTPPSVYDPSTQRCTVTQTCQPPSVYDPISHKCALPHPRT